MTDIELSKLDADERAKKRRAKQTVNNLILSLAACVGVVAIMVLAVPRPTTSLIPHVDYKLVAKQSASTSGLSIAAPKLLSKDWYSNAARFTSKPADGVAFWYVGFVNSKEHYLGLTQGFNANPTWTYLQLAGDIPTGSTKIAGLNWTIWQATTKNDPAKSRDYALVTDIAAANGQPTQQLIVFGTATKAELTSFATAVAQSVR